MEQDILKKLAEQDAKIDAIFTSVEKTRKYIMWTAIVTIAAVVLPLIGLLIAIPSYISTLNSITNI